MTRLLAMSLALLGCGSRTGLVTETLGDGSVSFDAAIDGTGGSGGSSACGSSGYCTTTTAPFLATFGGLAQGDAICAAEYPGAHFFRRSCDLERPFFPAVAAWPSGYGEIEAGDCWSCNGWTSPSGPFDPSIAAPGCTPGYATVAALVPAPMTGSASWRICEAGDWPLACCLP